MFKKPFNKQVGETRACKHCGNEFFTMKPIWKCTKCTNASQRIIEEKKRAKKGKKEQYPFNNYTNEAGARFHRIQRELRKAWVEFENTGDKSYVTNHYEKQLKEIQELGILKWIYDRRDDESKKSNRPKTANMTRKEYPDTRGYYEE
jgi:hypothetical protein